jgi:uncharacterized protein YyaL (SSP411 family)
MSTPSLNTLARASSAYLRSAMHQPIQWHEWGEDAFAAAQRDNKPILLDIGAVWCHWCHVMDRESYDDPEVAALVNQRFIAVKVDRDERPDIDSRYQAAVSALSGQGGWPLTAFLTPDGKPFYGGTYFPPTEQWGRPSFKRVLTAISDAYHEKHGEVTEQAAMVEKAIAQSESFAGRTGKFSPAIIDAIVESVLKMFDSRNGGFGHAPKFPHPAVIDLLIDRYALTQDDNLRNVIVTTLEKMARGGVYDQLAGGFHRYSVDERWIVPHFEKMCYDNSELLKCYVHAWQVTGSELFAEVARDIIRWMDEWLSDREHGGFYASQDADQTMEDDGDYFTWSLAEAHAVLTSEELDLATACYDIGSLGEMHHDSSRNVLFLAATVDELAARAGVTVERVRELLASAKRKMYAARLQRPVPYIDKTMYVGWNALCVSAYLQAATALELDDARRFALRSLDRILAEAWIGDALSHVVAYSDPQAEMRMVPGMLDDYAATAIACLDAYEATADIAYFRFAQKIADAMLARFFDPAAGGFFDTAASGDKLLGVLATRRKPFQDSPTPAGNSMAVIALLRLHAYTGDSRYRRQAEQTLELFGGMAGQYGIFAGTYGIAAVLFSRPEQRIVVIGDDARAEELFRQATRPFSFTRSALRLQFDKVVPQNLPPVLARTLPQLPALRERQAAAVVCSGFACQPPVHDPAKLQQLWKAS